MNSTRSSKGLRASRTWRGETLFANVCGRTLRGVAVSTGEHTLRLDFTSGPSVYVMTEGDCCSESWWADISGVKQALGHKVYEVEELDLPDPDQNDGRGRQEYDQAYGYKLRTSGGVVTLVFRNSSNGYYGGSAADATLEQVVRMSSAWARYTDEDLVEALRWTLVEENDWRA